MREKYDPVRRFSCHSPNFSNALNKRKKTVEEEAKFMTNPFLEIRDPQLNVSEIVHEIESKIPRNPKESIDLNELTKLSYKPESPAGFRKFDPAGTAHLFEKGISAPKFTNPKFWFVKGPIKYIISRIISVYSLVDKKLSENRIRAFFSVLHELVRLGKRMNQLEKRFDGFYREHLLHNQTKDIGLGFGWATSEYFVDSGLDEDWTNVINDLKESKNISVLFPEWGELLKQFSYQKYKFQSFSQSDLQTELIRKRVTANIQKIESTFPLKDYLPQESDVIISKALGTFPASFLERLFSELSVNMKNGYNLYFLIHDNKISQNSPFIESQLSTVNLKELSTYMNRLGFIEERNLSANPDQLIFRYTKTKG